MVGPIEKGIPAPKLRKNPNAGAPRKARPVYELMEVGDSVLCEFSEGGNRSFAVTATQWGKSHGRHFATRWVSPGTYRMWRVL